MAQHTGEGPRAEVESEISVERLRRDMESVRERDAGASHDTSGQRGTEIRDAVTEILYDGEEFVFDETYVKGTLDEILLLLVACRDVDTHGNQLITDLEMVFDTDLSPGTVYPHLHKLTDADLLEAQELLQTKDYQIDETEAVNDRIEEAMRQHLALGFFLYAARDEL